MADISRSYGQMLSLNEIAEYHKDVVSSLNYYFNEMSEYSTDRFFGYTPAEREEELKTRIDETGFRSILIILASLDASFRVDYESRCQKKFKDSLSRAFRDIHKKKAERASLDEDIFEIWKIHRVECKRHIGELRAAFKFRNWLAHGRYWKPKLGRNFDFEYVYDLATAVNEDFFGDRPVNP